MLPLDTVVAGGGVVVVDTGKGVVVVATIIFNHFSMTHLPTSDSLVSLDVTVTSPVTAAKNPLTIRVPVLT